MTIFEAIESHDLELVRKVLNLGVDPNAMMPKWPFHTALQTAILEIEEGGTIETVNLLLQYGAFAEDRSRSGVSALLIAVHCANIEIVRVLLSKGANASLSSGEGDSPLRHAVSEGKNEMAELLLENGAEKTINSWGAMHHDCMTALGIASSRLNIKMIELLMKYGADPLLEDDDEKTALHRLPERTTENSHQWDLAEKALKRVK